MNRMRVLSAVILYACLVSSALGATCAIYDVNSLKNCFNQGASVDHYDLQSDLTCWGDDCCATGGAFINLNGRSGVTFQGNGHLITRHSKQTQCPVISAYGVSNILITALRMDEDDSVERCLGDGTCGAAGPAANGAAIDIVGGTSVTMEDVGLYNAKMIGVYVKGVNGFVFNNSTVSNAGVLGIHIGENSQPSDNVWITNSVIAHTGANGLTLMGVLGDASDGFIDNVVRNNVFDTNHILGAYYTSTFRPLFNNGGQVYVAHANSVVLDYNLIADGRCDGCDGFQGYATVPAFELGASTASGGGPLSHVLFHANKIRNIYGPAFYKASGAQIHSTSAIWENDMRGVTQFKYPAGFSGPTFGSNSFGDYSPSANSYGYLSNFIHRMYSGTYHQEANWTWQHPNSSLNATYMLRGYPVPRASSRPIYRCLISSGTGDDFPSLDKNCEGWTLHSILGYSFEPGYPGAVPLHRCLIGYNHFVSTDPNCEGQAYVQMLGYVVPQ